MLVAARPCRAAPVTAGPSLAAMSSDDGVASIVNNFQDLSAVLSLFAADSVEKKLADPKSSDWERMSAFWSIFGIIGAVRVYAKIAAGLAGAETAGMELGGARAYTSRKTKKATCSCVIGPSERPPTWEDDEDLLLGLAKVDSTLWIRPHIVVMGFSRCPFTGRRALREAIGRGVFVLLTLAIPCVPIILLRRSVRGTISENLSLGMTAGSAFLGGCILPMLLQDLNSPGFAYLPDAGSRQGDGLLQAGDTVTTTKSRLCRIMWQSHGNRLPPPRSADLWFIRLLAAIATMFTVVGYVLNYILLGRAGSWRSYAWLGMQVVILVVRYILWAYRPHLIHSRRPTMVYAVTGSLLALRPLTVQIDPSHWPPSEPPLPRDAVYFAVASARSKLLNGSGAEQHLKLSNLDLLSTTAPRDILQAACYKVFCEMGDLSPQLRRRLRVVKLPWSFVEELYAAQGLILGHNPWVLGGISLAAVVDLYEHDDGREPQPIFLGLTTIHSCKPTKTEGVYEFKRQEPGAAAVRDVVGITYDNYGIEGTIELGVLTDRLPTPHTLTESHEKFRDNVAACRFSARLNGPPHCEVHVQEFGDGTSPVVEHNSKTEAFLADVIQYGKDVIWYTRNKDHTDCTEVCKIFGF